ncbi:MAG: LON peptidase substrate-binding domain-containing protein, partial [Thermomicrobiaceae bacterium]
MVEQFTDNEDQTTDIPDPEHLEEASKTETPEIIPILPLRGTVVFPMTLVPLAAGQARSLRLIDDVVSGDRIVGLVLQHDQEQEGADPGETYEIGVVANIHQMMRVPDGTVRLAIQGVRRMRIVEWIGEEPYLTARIEEIPEEAD